MKVNLGCPYQCADYDACIDLAPFDTWVIKAEAISYLQQHPYQFEHINAKNLIEHLPNVGSFFQACYLALKLGGVLTFETDNAAWFPFYIPYMHWLMPRRTWIGAAVNPDFNRDMNNSPHLYTFTFHHLRMFALRYGFLVKKEQYVKYGAHLWCCWQKN